MRIADRGDSLGLTLDKQGRAPSLMMRGPSGTPIQMSTLSWNPSGGLTSLDHQVNVFGTPNWSPLQFDREDAIDSVGGALVWFWHQQDSANATGATFRDSVTYDGWSRVQRWKEFFTAGSGAMVTRDYSFDPMGNLFGGGGLLYDSTTNRLKKEATGGFLTYDRAGNLTAKLGTGVTYGYDALERLVSVRQGAVLIARYGYDVAGRRIAKRVYSTATGGTAGYLRMVYAGNQVAFETDSNNTALATIYTWGPGVDNLVAVQVGGTQYTVVTDALGSVRALVRRSDGAGMGRLRYDPYGQLIDSAGPQPVLRYRWTGREWDAETGFYFHRSRYYDPGVGRFVQEDQIGYAGGGNLYAYVNGNVLQARDPGGTLPTYDRYRRPDECCGKWANGWDGWFGIIGSILPTPVWFATLSLDGTTTSFVLPRSWSNKEALSIDLGIGRPLSDLEISSLANLCSPGSDLCSGIRLFTGLPMPDGRALTLGSLIFAAWGDDAPVGRIIGSLAHEVTHTLQYEVLGFTLAFSVFLGEQSRYEAFQRFGIGSSPYDWAVQYRADPTRSFWSYTLEGQAQLVGECFAAGGNRGYTACQVSPFGPGR